jgi:hypothetical protein
VTDARGRARLFFSFLFFIYFIQFNSIQFIEFNSISKLAFLKDARELVKGEQACSHQVERRLEKKSSPEKKR